MRKHFSIGKTFLGSCKAQMLGHKRVSCPGAEHKYLGDGRRGGGSIVQHQERKLCCVQKPIYYNNRAILTDWASCLLCGIGMKKIYLFSEIQLLFCLHSPCPMAFHSSLPRNISPKKGDPVTQPRAALGLLLPLVKAGRERIIIHNCIHKPFLLKPQNNYRYDHSLSDSFLGTPVFWQVLSQECVLTGTA